MSFHALTCDPDCPSNDCYCDCPCHLRAVSIETATCSGKMTREDQKKAPAANGGQSLTPTAVEGGTAQ